MTLSFEDVTHELGLDIDGSDFLNRYDISILKGAFSTGFGTLTALFKNTNHDRASEYYKETSVRAVKVLEETAGHIPFSPVVYAMAIPPLAKPSETILHFTFEQDVAADIIHILGYEEAIQTEDFESAEILADHFNTAQQDFYVAMAVALMEGKGFEVGQRLLVDQFKDMHRDEALEDGYIIDEIDLDMMAEESMAQTILEDKQEFLNEMRRVIDSFDGAHPELMKRYKQARREFEGTFLKQSRSTLARRQTPFRPGGSMT